MVQRDSIVSAAISVALHGGVIALAYAWLAGSATPDVRVAESTAPTIDIAVAPEPPPPPSLEPATVVGPAAPAAAARVTPGPSGRRGATHTALLPSRAINPYAELTVSVDTPLGTDSTGAAPDGTGPGLGVSGAAPGAGGGNGGGGLPGIPEPPRSRARPPIPKFDYSEVIIHGSRAYFGKQIKLLLTIGPSGTVTGARVMQSVELHLDLHAVRIAHQFEFEPALDVRGQPTTGQFPWTFAMVL